MCSPPWPWQATIHGNEGATLWITGGNLVERTAGPSDPSRRAQSGYWFLRGCNVGAEAKSTANCVPEIERRSRADRPHETGSGKANEQAGSAIRCWHSCRTRALAIAWPKLAPLATCLQEVAQNAFPIKPETEGDEWRKFYLATMIGAVGVLIGSLMRGRLLTFVLGLIAGLGLAMVWPKLAPVATCLQELAQNEFPIKTGPV